LGVRSPLVAGQHGDSSDDQEHRQDAKDDDVEHVSTNQVVFHYVSPHSGEDGMLAIRLDLFPVGITSGSPVGRRA
jgi:hypothetical protein